MNLTILKNDFKRNRAGNVALLLFMTLAAGLVVAATIVVMQLTTSMTQMYQTAKPPHFMQMHIGEIDQKAIDDFTSTYEGVTAWQTVPMIDVYGEDLTIKGKDTYSLSDCILEISLVKQNKGYDLLLDADRNVLKVGKGEIGVPVILLDSYDIDLGDTLVLTSNGITKSFTVTSFIHDAQMNSTLCYSTRMLINDEDFDELFGRVGEKEYLIETYFTDPSLANGFQKAYEDAELPQDGQAVTYTIIILLGAMTDILMAMVLILVSILLIMVALLCMKYTMMAALEEEIGEIGTMKAIGMSYKDIRSLYLVKYKILMAVGIAIGYVLALVTSNMFTGHVANTFGKQPVSILTVGLPFVACLLVYFITNRYCKKILKKLKKVSVVDALVSKKGFGKKERVKDGLYKSKSIPVNLLMSVRETFHNFSGFVIVFAVMFTVSGIMIVPVNLLNTMKAKEFITYMGSSMDDILIEIDSGDKLNDRYVSMKELLNDESDIEEYKEFKQVRVETMNKEDKSMNLYIDSGNGAGEELKYLEGRAPNTENEIALSKLNADEMGKNTGDPVTLRFNDIQKEFVVSGVYQDVTSGGKTAKATYSFAGVEAEKYTFTINLEDGVNPIEKASIWSDKMGGGVNIEPMEEFIKQTLGGVARQVEVATTAVTAIGILLVALIIVLFMKLRLVKDVAQIAAMKAIGFTNSDIRNQYLYKIGLVSFGGIVLGTIISNILGENLVSMAFSMMGLGISRITFIINPWMVFILLPLVLLAITAVMTWISTGKVREFNIISLINE